MRKDPLVGHRLVRELAAREVVRIASSSSMKGQASIRRMTISRPIEPIRADDAAREGVADAHLPSLLAAPAT